MLKAFLGFLVSVVVLLSSAYVPPAYAASASVLITHIQAGGSGAATQEFVAIYNNSTSEVDISDWCLTNKTRIAFACFSVGPGQSRYLPAHSYAIAGSAALVTALASSRIFTTTYLPLSQSSGSVTGGSDTISLIGRTGAVVDQHAWTTPLAGGTQLERHQSATDPLVYDDTDTAADWSIAPMTRIPEEGTVTETVAIDVCVNIDGEQLSVPEGMVSGVDAMCQERVITEIDITELLPNAIGGDEGNEFIELYNPNDEAVNLAGYMLWVGLHLDVSYDFPADMIVPAHSYLTFSNADIPFSLLNSSSRVSVTTEDGFIVSEVPAYVDPEDGASWALIGGAWQYTKLSTPGAENASLALESEIESKTSVTPCAVNQYRNPETGRCRLLATVGATSTPCRDGQYRSEETNRCRNIVAASTPAPCKEGQERNPDTNRCRMVTKLPSADYAVLGAKAASGGSWYAWIVIGSILLLALGYAIWEWHVEIGKFVIKQVNRVPLFARLRK